MVKADMAATTTANITPYELYSDAPGFLLNKPEWEAAHSAHGSAKDFGTIPQGWPKRLDGPQVWTGKDLLEHCMCIDPYRRPGLIEIAEQYLTKLSAEQVQEIHAALQVVPLDPSINYSMYQEPDNFCRSRSRPLTFPFRKCGAPTFPYQQSAPYSGRLPRISTMVSG